MKMTMVFMMIWTMTRMINDNGNIDDGHSDNESENSDSDSDSLHDNVVMICIIVLFISFMMIITNKKISKLTTMRIIFISR